MMEGECGGEKSMEEEKKWGIGGKRRGRGGGKKGIKCPTLPIIFVFTSTVHYYNYGFFSR
jgi:hypothetical protein